MVNPTIIFLKKTYKIWAVIISIVIFFIGYNTYLIDRSLANLRFALDKINNLKSFEEAKKLAVILDSSLLLEIASKELSPSNIAKLELARDILSKSQSFSKVEKDATQVASALYLSLLDEVAEEELQETSIPMIEVAKDILTKPQDISQLEDVKFALSEVIRQKEENRHPILVALDRINQAFVNRAKMLPKAKLERQERNLREILSVVKDKEQLQELYYELGNIYTQLSEFSQAKQAYKKVIDLNPDSKLGKKSYFNLAWNEKIRGNLDEAISEFEAIAQRFSQEELGVFSQYQVADILRKKGDYKKAISVYDDIVKKYPQTDLVQIVDFQVGYSYLYELKDYEEAKKRFEQSEQLLRDTSFSKHIKKMALPSIRNQYRRLGFLLLREGYESSLFEKYKGALDNFDSAIAIDPMDGISYTGKALAFLWLKKPDMALDMGRKAVKLNPQDEIVSVNLGYIFIQLNLVDEAIEEFRRFISVNPFFTFRAYYNLGYAYAIKGKLAEAISAFQQATKVDPKSGAAFNNLGWCLWQLGRYAEAIEAFERGVRVESNFLDAVFNLGLAYKAAGRYQEAKKKFETILLRNSQYRNVQDQLREVERIIQSRQRR